MDGLLPRREVELDRFRPHGKGHRPLAALSALDELFGPAVECGDDGMLAIAPGSATLRDPAPQHVAQAAGRRADEAHRADCRVADCDAQRDDRSFAMADDRRAAKVQLAASSAWRRSRHARRRCG